MFRQTTNFILAIVSLVLFFSGEARAEVGSIFPRPMIAFGQPFWNRVDAFIDQYFFVVVGLAILFPAILIIEAMKLRSRRSQKEAGENAGLISRLPRSWYLLVLSCVVLGGTTYHLSQQLFDYQQRYQRTRDKLEKTVDDYYLAETGKRPEPFQPIRPRHPKRMGGVYYRGNDERHVELYNGGYYQTARLTVFLKTNDGSKIDYGSQSPENALLEFEIEASPKTAPGLFDQSIMGKVFLSELRNDRKAAAGSLKYVRLKVVEENKKWKASYPIPWNVENVSSLPRYSQSGLIFVYLGDPETNPFSATPHYGIRYQIDLQNGKIQPTSEVWLGPIYVPENALIASDKQISLSEWLDDRPMPEIKTDHTSDPKLIGEDQYDGLKKNPAKSKK